MDLTTHEGHFRALGIIAYTEKATEDEKTLIKFGMTPVTLLEKMDLDMNEMDREAHKNFTLGLMEAAGGEMRV